MRTLFVSGLLLSVSLLLLAADDTAVDTVTKQATQLETQLSKVNSTTGEAAELMLKLIDVYHENGRVFGLIRVGQSFVALHTNHPRHRDAMLKLMDGLRATGRNKEITALGRQFLLRHPKDAACADVERLLAQLLVRAIDTPGAAVLNEARWRRLGPTPEGREAGFTAVAQLNLVNNAENHTHAATLADEIFDKLPASGPATTIGWQAIGSWESVNNWAKANLTAAKLLQKSPPTSKTDLQELHRRMGENYARAGQRANAVESFRKALAVAPRVDIHARLIQELSAAAAKPAEIEPVVNDYVQKYPEREDRHGMRVLVGVAYQQAGDKARAEQIYKEILPIDARAQNAIGNYMSLIPGNPARGAEAEQVLRDALAKSKPANMAPLRYSLAIDIYRDRLKDVAKARATGREFITQFAVNEAYTQNLINWMLDSAASDAEFQADFAIMLEARKQRPYWEFHRNILPAWLQSRLGNKAFAKKVEFAKAELAKADRDPAMQAWLALEKAARANDVAQASFLRAKLMTPALLATYSDELANDLFYQQQYYYRYQAPPPQQPKSVEVCKQWTQRLPKSEYAAYQYLSWAIDFGLVAAYRDAVQHLLTIEPTGNNADIWRRMMQVAQHFKDAALAKQCWTWIQNAHKKFGYDPSYSSYIGDCLEAVGMKPEALECWKKGIPANYDLQDSRTCADRVMARMEPAAKAKFLDEMLQQDSYWHFSYAVAKADDLLKAGDLAGFEKLLMSSAQRQRERAIHGGNMDNDWQLMLGWVATLRNDMKAKDADKRRVFTVLRDLKIHRPSEAAAVALLELPEAGKPQAPMSRLLAYNEATLLSYGDATDWDLLVPYAQAALTRKDYVATATLVAGMLANCPVDEGRRKPGRDMVTQAYSRMGTAGAAIDDKSPIAPLLQAALQLRLGDQKLAFDTYLANQKLFDAHRQDVPVDLLLFVCESHIAAGGDEQFNRAEDILRSWIVKHGEAKEIDDVEKARVQLLLAKNYFRSRRYDLARAEYTTVLNRYGKTPQAIEAEFGIGETFMEQKVYDQAETTFERLAGRRERDVVIRAEFLRGVLASRRGDRDDARLIFRGVLERVPTVELANQVLYNLSEVYGAEQRYMDQLELLRTVGRLGRNSKRWHAPGEPLSIVVQDSDLGISRGHARIPVRVITEPGGDEEIIYLRSGGAGKGLFRADLETRLGTAVKGDKILQLTGKDIIRCDYPDDFKKEFKDVPLPDSEIRIAADAKLEIASSKIMDQEEENFSKKLEREARGDETADKRVGLSRPTNQIKPGNLIYLRLQDADRDVSDKPDTITVKLIAASGDQVQATLTETGPHTGIFEGTAKTGELPAGAHATNTAIDHSPLMAIDRDPKTFWISEPDGITPKVLTIDMKELKRTDQVTISTPDPKQHAPVRGYLEGSNDGRLWFHLASNPVEPTTPALAGEAGHMSQRVYLGQNGANFTTWAQVIEMTKTAKPAEENDVERLSWARPAESTSKPPVSLLWHGKLVQPRPGAARIGFKADTAAVMLDGRLELPVGKGDRTVDVWLDAGTHDLTIFAAGTNAATAIEALWARADNNAQEIILGQFKALDFDLDQAIAKPAPVRKPPQVTVDKDGKWDFRFAPIELRHVRLVVQEYRGEAVAINHVEIQDSESKKVHIPTETDLLSLANNDVLEIAGGDTITASYVDELNMTGNSRLLSAQLTATYFNAVIAPIGYNFVKLTDGSVATVRKQVLRVDPGERFIVEVIDYDQDRTAKPDTVKILVSVNDGEPVKLNATETGDNTGIFTKEVDTSAKTEEGKLTIKAGDRIYCRYIDEQNTLPGHAVARETVVYVTEPTEGKLRIVDTRAIQPKEERAPPEVTYLPHDPARTIARVAFEAPLTVEVIDRDAAKDSLSTVTVALTTTDGAKVEVLCALADGVLGQINPVRPFEALEEGRFIGQVILQLGGKDSPSLVPLTSAMPRNLIGGAKLTKEEAANKSEAALVTRVLNLTGKDMIEATYVDALRPKGGEKKLTTQGRMVTEGKLSCTDAEYQKDVTGLHVGERLYLKVVDADQDKTDDRDKVRVTIRSKRGEKETVELIETQAHSGVFMGSLLLKPEEKPTPDNLKADNPVIECWFGDTLDLAYVDEAASTPTGINEVKLSVAVVIGTDGKLAAFSKKFSDEALAVETQFHVAESHFELFKSHKSLQRTAEARADLEAGRRVLREVMEDYPNPKYIPRIAYLLGQFAQELHQWQEAIESYQLIVRQYPDHTLAPDAQFKLAQCYEEAGEFAQALEAYVTLAATYPKNPLIANVMLRISEHFYKAENFKVAAQVGEKFLEKFEGHKWSSKMAFRVGQCYFKDKQYKQASDAFDRFAKLFHDDALGSDALFWSGESFRMGNNNKEAFVRYNKCRWDYPSSDAAKYARGRLALPEMLRQFEESSNLENK